MAALPVAHLGANYLTSENRFNDMRSTLDGFEGAEADQPHDMSCEINAENVSLPYSMSGISGGVFTGKSENGLGCMEGTFINYGELIETGLFDVSLTRVYQDADARSENPKLCISNIKETVVFGIPLSSESTYDCMPLD